MIVPLVGLLFIVPPPGAWGQPITATIQQQAEIAMYIDLARHAADDSEDELKRPRNQIYYDALKNKRDLEKKMGIPHDDWGNPLRTPNEQDLKKISGNWLGWNDMREDYAKAAKTYGEAHREAAENYKKAIELTVEYYNIKSNERYDYGHARNGPPWERGKFVVWNPKFNERPRLKSQDPAVYEDRKDFGDLPGFIAEDGTVSIRDAAFKYPGYLAHILNHERKHVADFLTPESELDLRNEPLAELRHRWGALINEDVYQLTPYDWKQELKNYAWQNDLYILWRDAISARKDPYNSDDRKLIFSQLNISDDRVQEIDAQIERDTRLMANVDSTNPESLEHLRTHAESSFLKDLNDYDMRNLVTNWKKTHEIERRKSEEKSELDFQKLLHSLRYEAARCGFESHDQHESEHYGYGFLRKDPSCSQCTGTHYYYTAPTDLVAAKAAFLLTRACLDAGQKQLCNDSIDEMQTHWDEADFRASLALRTSGGGPHRAQCVLHLRDNMKPPFDSATLNLAIQHYLAIEAEKDRQSADDYYRRELEETRAKRRAEARQRRQGDDGNAPPREPGWRHPCQNLSCVPPVPW